MFINLIKQILMRKNKEIYLIFFWIILIIVIVTVFIFPNLNNIKAISKKNNETKSQLEAMQKSNQSKEETEKNYHLIKNDLSTIEAVIPKRGEELSFITVLEEIANKNQLTQKINIILAKNEQTNSVDQEILPFQITLDGNFYNFLNYLVDLELSQYYLNIEKVQINQSQLPIKTFIEGEPLINPNEVHVILTGNSYWQ